MSVDNDFLNTLQEFLCAKQFLFQTSRIFTVQGVVMMSYQTLLLKISVNNLGKSWRLEEWDSDC